jgi:ABC-type taurine transport system ATPase subunit
MKDYPVSQDLRVWQETVAKMADLVYLDDQVSRDNRAMTGGWDQRVGLEQEAWMATRASLVILDPGDERVTEVLRVPMV